MRPQPSLQQYLDDGRSRAEYGRDLRRWYSDWVRAENKPAIHWYDEYVAARRRFDELCDKKSERKTEVEELAKDDPERYGYGRLWYAGRDAIVDSIDQELNVEYSRRVDSQWALGLSGAAAVPYALDMLKARDSTVREDGAGVLAMLGEQEEVVSALLETLSTETDLQVIDTVVYALGEMRAKAALPAIAQLVRNSETDGDTRWGAASALGRIVRRRFDRKEDPVVAAIEWLDAHPTGTEAT
jgi:hypothetical protein